MPRAAATPTVKTIILAASGQSAMRAREPRPGRAKNVRASIAGADTIDRSRCRLERPGGLGIRAELGGGLVGEARLDDLGEVHPGGLHPARQEECLLLLEAGHAQLAIR